MERRELFRLGAVGVAAGVGTPLLLPSPAEATTQNPYIWALNTNATIAIPTRNWTYVAWPSEIVNVPCETKPTLSSGNTIWNFDSLHYGLWALIVEVAWENDNSWEPHRRAVRVVAGTGGSFVPVATAEVNSAVTNGSGDDDLPQFQQVCLQPGFLSGCDQLAVQVWHNRGTVSPPSPVNLVEGDYEAQSFMMCKLSEIIVDECE